MPLFVGLMVDNSTKVDLSLALDAARQAAQAGREVLMSYYGQLSQIQTKDQAGLVSEADIESEKVITQVLQAEFPNISIVAEESSYQSGSQEAASESDVWFIDPLDGTTNYVHQFPAFCISIGLQIKGELVVGLVEVPVLNQCFTAIRGQGAFLNGEKIEVSRRAQLKNSLLATGFFIHDPKTLDQQIELLKKMLGQSRGIRRAGSAAYDLCMVAAGVFDAYWESSLNPWDTAAGTVLVREAGGKVTDFLNQDFHPMKKQILASNLHLHDECLRALGS